MKEKGDELKRVGHDSSTPGKLQWKVFKNLPNIHSSKFTYPEKAIEINLRSFNKNEEKKEG